MWQNKSPLMPICKFQSAFVKCDKKALYSEKTYQQNYSISLFLGLNTSALFVVLKACGFSWRTRSLNTQQYLTWHVP